MNAVALNIIISIYVFTTASKRNIQHYLLINQEESHYYTKLLSVKSIWKMMKIGA